MEVETSGEVCDGLWSPEPRFPADYASVSDHDDDFDECILNFENLFRALNFEELKPCTCRSRSVSPGHMMPVSAPKRKRSFSEPTQDKKSKI